MKHIPASAIRTAAFPLDYSPPLERPCDAFRTTELFGLPLANAPADYTAAKIVDWAGEGRSMTINFVNAHCVNQAHGDDTYRRDLAASDLLLPDGIGIDLAARMCGAERPENLNGTDLFPRICERAAVEGTGLFLLGGLPGVADAAAEWACSQWPSLRIRGTHDGYFDPLEEDALVERINASRAAILLVGMGVPFQERWIARNRARLKIPVVMGVGGLFDYYSGRVPRAPSPVRRMRCEWMWRLAMEPRRMARRYLIGNLHFMCRAAAEAARVRKFSSRIGEGAKRLFDIVAATLAILMLLPVFLLTALAVFAEDRGPVFFRQSRVGAKGQAFMMIKFRSMFTDAEERRAALLAQSDRAGTCFKMLDDPRITRVGKIIRRLSIDELPQLFNVLGGSMSLVGPRPALPGEAESYRGNQWERLHGKPGITCSWQVKGRAEIPFHRQAIMDRAYLRHRSFAKDLRLLAMTVPAVLGGRGAY